MDLNEIGEVSDDNDDRATDSMDTKKLHRTQTVTETNFSSPNTGVSNSNQTPFGHTTSLTFASPSPQVVSPNAAIKKVS